MDKQVKMDVLLIDDEPGIRHSVGGYLQDIGHNVLFAEEGTKGLSMLDEHSVDILITDVRMPKMDGFEVLQRAKKASPNTEVIMVTAYGDINGAVRAIREGAFDFFTKPVKLRDLSASIERTTRFQTLKAEKEYYKEQLARLDGEIQNKMGLAAIIGESPKIQKVKHDIYQVAQTSTTTVLVQGETGTGKEMVARAIHRESQRASGPFIAVDCSAIPENLIESEFYGHEKGSFTGAQNTKKGHFEVAEGGTIFLDEIGDMDIGTQSRLLRTLEERCVRRVGGHKEIPIDVRVVSATNKDLFKGVEEKTFREDLFYRLNTFTIQLPPLRERPEDIPLLAQHFLTRFAHEMRKPITGLTKEASTRLMSYPFLGNIRELRNMIERGVILCQNDRLDVEHLQLAPVASSRQTTEPATLNLAIIEENLIRKALDQANGHRGNAAQLLGLSRDALRRRLERYGL